ncbi:MAG TPA: hypothetical protein VGJ26_00365 [Pirellulales bacterium]|jgi:hypothetical protein
MPEPQPLIRRWTYSLRTLFLAVTLAAVFLVVLLWIRGEMAFIRERREAIANTKAPMGDIVADLAASMIDQDIFVEKPAPSESLGIPFWRVWLGDQPIQSITLRRAATEEELTHGKRLFPEATVERFNVEFKLKYPPGFPGR